MTRRVAIAMVRRRSAAGLVADQDLVAVEAPLALVLRRHGDERETRLGLLMRTPGDDGDLIAGFLYTEGIVDAPGDIRRIAVGRARRRSDTAVVTLAPSVRWPPDGADRATMTTSACGLCGRLAALAIDRGRACPPGRPRLEPSLVTALPRRLRRGQRVFAETGGLHAAALIEPDGTRQIIREDIGRHNAVDKAIGAALTEGWLPAHDFVLAVSGRVAYEIVQKAVTAGLAGVVAVGAPSSLAVDAARGAGLTLVGFARGGTFNVYAGWDRVPGGGEFPADRT